MKKNHLLRSPILSKGLVPTLLFAILALAFLARTWNYRAALKPGDGEVVIADNDAPYHMLRSVGFAKSLRNQIQGPDPRTYFPEGYVCHWSPGFDFVLGSLGRIFYKIWPNDYLLKILISFLVPILGTLTLLVYFFLWSHFCSRGSALIATLLFSLLPVHLTATYFAVVDHHVAEFFFLVIVYWAATRQTAEKGNSFLSAFLFLGFWIVPGFILDFIVLSISVGFVILIAWRWESCGKFIESFARSYFLAWLVLTPSLYFSYFGRQGAVLFESLSFFQSAVLAASTLCLFLLRGLQDRRERFSAWSAGLMATSLSLIALLLVPGVLSALSGGLTFTHGSPYWRLSVEMNPPNWGVFTAGLMKGFWPFVLIGILSLAAHGIRRRSAPMLLLVIPPMIYGVLAISEQKFLRYFFIFGIGSGVFFCETLFHFVRYNTRLRWGLTFAFVILAAIQIPEYKRVLHLHESDGSEPVYGVLKFIEKRYVPGRDGATVFAPWDMGHKIIYYTGFSNMDNPFLIQSRSGHTRDIARFHFATDERTGVEILNKYKAKLVIVDPLPYEMSLLPFLTEAGELPYFKSKKERDDWLRTTLNYRLYQEGDAPSRTVASGQTQPGNFRFFRLVFETKEKIPVGEREVPAFKVFEQVRGSDLFVQRTSDRPPTLELWLETNAGRKFKYQQFPSKVGADWKYHVPYAAPGINGEVKAVSPYRLWDGSNTTEVELSERAIVEGAEKRIGIPLTIPKTIARIP